MTQAALHATDLVIGRSLITAETVAAELRARLVKRLEDLQSQWMPEQRLLAEARAVLAEFEPILAELASNSDLFGWLAGYNRVAVQLPPKILDSFRSGWRPPPPRFTFPGLIGDDGGNGELRFPQLEKAVKSLLEREVLTREQFDAVHADAKYRAFTVANIDSAETLREIRDALAENVREGASLAGFRNRVTEALDASPIGPAHLENVYRTNIQAAFRDGREALASHPIVAQVFPYQEFLPIHDGRVRDDHLALATSGLNKTGIYRRDDPIWEFCTPPLDYNCRCGVNLLRIAKAADKGVKEAQDWRRTGNPPATPEWCIDRVTFRPRSGFGARRGSPVGVPA